MISRSILASIVLATAMGAIAVATAGAPTKPKDSLPGTWTVKGECKRLVVRNAKLTSACTGEVTRTKSPDGTIIFNFSDGKNWLTFRTKEASARLWQGYKTTLEVDGVAFGPIGSEPDFTTKIAGECSYGAPYFGQAAIGCSALVDFRMWASTIKTDGRLPLPVREYIAPTRSAP